MPDVVKNLNAGVQAVVELNTRQFETMVDQQKVTNERLDAVESTLKLQASATRTTNTLLERLIALQQNNATGTTVTVAGKFYFLDAREKKEVANNFLSSFLFYAVATRAEIVAPALAVVQILNDVL